MEPRSEVLDFVLHRTSAPPCREGLGVGRGELGLSWGGGGEEDE